MCNACGNPAAPGHWTEAGTISASDRLRARFRRADLLRSVLKPYGLTVHDDGSVPGIQVGKLSGGQTIVPDLEQLWTEAEKLAGQMIDPLDPRYLEDE